MNVGILSWIIDRQRTGVDNYLYDLLENMIKMGKSKEISLIHYKKIEDPVYTRTNDIIIPKMPLKLTNIIGMPKAIKSANIDILHVPAHFHTQIAPFFLNRNIKKILTIHDLIPLLFPKTYSRDTSFLWNSSLKLIKNRIDHVIAVSQKTKDDCIKYFDIPDEKVTIIPNAVNARYKPIKNIEEVKNNLKMSYKLTDPFILFTGRIEARKNVPVLIKALYKLKKMGLKHKLVVVGGRGWKYEETIGEIERLNLQESVIFPGYVPDEDLVKLYNAADLFVYPSLYEGFGLPPLEAMACGTPVITSNTSSLPEVVGNAGIMVNPKDVNGLAESMHRVLTDNVLKEDLSKKSLERSKKFSWEKSANETWKVYESILD